MATRRQFLQQTAATVGAIGLGLGCDGDDSGAMATDDVGDVGSDVGNDTFVADSMEDDTTPVDTTPPPPACDDPFEGAAFVGTLPFQYEGTTQLDAPIGAGLDGRLYHDLEGMDDDTLLTPMDKFYIRTRNPDQLTTTEGWTIQITGLIDEPVTLTMDDLEPYIVDMGVHLMECSGNGPFAHFGMLSATRFRGVPIQDILDLLQIQPEATALVISGFDDHSQPSANSQAGAAWFFPFEQLTLWGGFLATHMGGEPLTPDHGAPVRFLMPRWYGCTCIKWLNEIRVVDDSEPATSQMREFASRTHQTGIPTMAASYRPAAMEQSAMPIRVEHYQRDGEDLYRVVGILWGGWQVVDSLEIRLGEDTWDPVDVCPVMVGNDTWTLWSHQWIPTRTGDHVIRMRVADGDIPTIRLDAGFYDRTIRIPG